MEHLHFVGIGGIGMSALAAMCRYCGMKVSGSDRGAERPENRRIFDALKNQGITVYPQDGSYAVDGKPDFLIYSTAIEEDNPDFLAGEGIPRLHRSMLIARMLEKLPPETVSIAVTGSCGKSTVTAYIAEALANAGKAPGLLNGALSKRFRSPEFAGNFFPGDGSYFVFEADESDKSLLNYGADYAVILNMGTDHYSREELTEVFGRFLAGVRRGAVLESGVYCAIRDAGLLPPGLPLRIFGGEGVDGVTDTISGYHIAEKADRLVPVAVFGAAAGEIDLPMPGEFMAYNALAVKAALELTGAAAAGESLKALSRFDGVWRRNDFAGKTSAGTPVYDDYAHNPEKIRSSLRLMRELCRGRIFAYFQPHGYGPFGFMREQLFAYLEEELRPGDRFMLPEPFYAGGTSSFKPTSAEVTADWQSRSEDPERYILCRSREETAAYLCREAGADDLIVIMGARDNSLSDYAVSLTGGKA